MSIEDDIFKRANFDFEKLKQYGFQKSKSDFMLEKYFFNDEFKAVIAVNENGQIRGDVIEVSSQELYLPLRVMSMAEGFAGQVRAEYEKILRDILAHCCVVNDFVYAQTCRLVHYIQKKYGDKPDFPWEKYGHYGVFRNFETNKWYALVMNIDRCKIEKNRHEEVEIVNLKVDQSKISDLLEKKGIYPAYHMNKKSWVTLVLDDTLSDEFIEDLLAQSYFFSQSKKKKV